ncbi:MAG: hypothetical protein ACYSTF_04470 [Planctomycetota bacterium]
MPLRWQESRCFWAVTGFYGGANLAFYDGHVENLPKAKVWIPEHTQQQPYQPGIWVVNRDLWQKNGGGI